MTGGLPEAPRIDYWFSTASSWAWLGSARFSAIARRAGAVVRVLPVDLGAVFLHTGGTPFADRTVARQTYRQLELTRWSQRLDIPIRLTPAHYPVDRAPSSRLIIAAREQGLDAVALSHAILRGIWAEDRDIADWGTLQEIADRAHFDGAMLVRRASDPATLEAHHQDTREAIAAGVFGSPTFVIDGERFWGQDRLDFVEERLGGIPRPLKA